MKELAVAKVYAKSLLELGDEAKVAITDEMIRLTELINKSNDLENLLFLDLFTVDEKKIVFADVAKMLQLSTLSVETVRYLIDEKRIGLLPLIIKEVVVLDDDRKGFMRGTIEGVSEEVDPSLKKKIELVLRTRLGREPRLEYKKNINLSAGYKVTIEDLQLDASLDNQLEQFKQSVLSE